MLRDKRVERPQGASNHQGEETQNATLNINSLILQATVPSLRWAHFLCFSGTLAGPYGKSLPHSNGKEPLSLTQSSVGAVEW